MGKANNLAKIPNEILKIADTIGINGSELIHASKLTAKVDNTALQDGYHLYTHNFILTNQGKWAVIQQGMNATNKTARRYNWHSENLESFIDEPHSGIEGVNHGKILNLTAANARQNRLGILEISHSNSEKIMADYARLILPKYHDIRATDIDLKRLGALLAVTREMPPENF